MTFNGILTNKEIEELYSRGINVAHVYEMIGRVHEMSKSGGWRTLYQDVPIEVLVGVVLRSEINEAGFIGRGDYWSLPEIQEMFRPDKSEVENIFKELLSKECTFYRRFIGGGVELERHYRVTRGKIQITEEFLSTRKEDEDKRFMSVHSCYQKVKKELGLEDLEFFGPFEKLVTHYCAAELLLFPVSDQHYHLGLLSTEHSTIV